MTHDKIGDAINQAIGRENYNDICRTWPAMITVQCDMVCGDLAVGTAKQHAAELLGQLLTHTTASGVTRQDYDELLAAAKDVAAAIERYERAVTAIENNAGFGPPL